MPQRRYIVSILFDFGIFPPFAFSPPLNIFRVAVY